MIATAMYEPWGGASVITRSAKARVIRSAQTLTTECLKLFTDKRFNNGWHAIGIKA